MSTGFIYFSKLWKSNSVPKTTVRNNQRMNLKPLIKFVKKKACTFEFRFVNNDRHRKPLTTARKRRRFQRCGKSKIICRRHDFEIRTHRGFTFKWIFITSPRHYVWVRGIRIEFWDPLFVLKILGKTRQRETG